MAGGLLRCGDPFQAAAQFKANVTPLVAAFSGGQSAAVDCRMGRATAKFPAVKA